MTHPRLMLCSTTVAACLGVGWLPATEPPPGFVLPSPTQAVRLIWGTNTAPELAGTFNAIGIEAFGERLLPLPDGLGAGGFHTISVRTAVGERWFPDVGVKGLATLSASTGGLDWKAVRWDLSATLREPVRRHFRTIVFVVPDLFVVHDHLEADEPVNVELRQTLPRTARLDPVWGDLTVQGMKCALVIHSASKDAGAQHWVLDAPATPSIPEPPLVYRSSNGIASRRVDLLTVYAVRMETGHRDFAFKRLESETAVGLRVHRDGLPVLIGFRTAADGTPVSLTGFGFGGVAGVSVFQPKHARPAR